MLWHSSSFWRSSNVCRWEKNLWNSKPGKWKGHFYFRCITTPGQALRMMTSSYLILTWHLRKKNPSSNSIFGDLESILGIWLLRLNSPKDVGIKQTTHVQKLPSLAYLGPYLYTRREQRMKGRNSME